MVLAVAAVAGCGKKGPPLAPLRLVPDAPAEVTVRRAGDKVQLRFALPKKNVNGPGAVALDRVEIYAITTAPGAAVPANRDLLARTYLVGAIAVKPPAAEGEPTEENASEDKRPSPGEVVTFVEDLTEDKLKSVPTVQPADKRPPGETPVSGAEGPAAPAVVTYPVRTYVIRGMTRSGRPGAPSPRVALPIVPLPGPPSAVAATFNERAVTITWFPPVAADSTPPPQLTFNVYASGGERPLNAAALAEPTFEHPGAEFGKEQCFAVRAVNTVANVAIESDPSPPACVTPRDIFPPAAPKGLRAVSGPGAINLIWDPNTEPDLGGYVVLRGEAPGQTLQPLTPSPIHETNYRDATVVSGMRYVYVVVAVDNATPPNTSASTAREEETAR